MKNKILSAIAISAFALANLGVAPAAQAATVHLEVPKPLMDIWKKIQTERTRAQETENLAPAPAPAPSVQPSAPMTPPPVDQPPAQPPMQQPPSQDQNPGLPNNQMPNPPMNGPGNPPNGQPNQNFDNRDIRQLKQGAGQLDKMMDRFNNQMQNTEKNGGRFSPDMRQRTSQTKQLLQKIKGSDNVNDMGENTMEQVQSNMSQLEQDGQDAMRQAQQLKGMQQGVKNMERGLTMFEKQVAKLTAQGITAPAEVTENLAKAKELIAAVKNAKSFDDLQESGADDIGGIMQSLNESRGQLEMLSRWSQTQKQIDKEIKNLERALSKDKTISDKLSAQGVDLSENLQKISDTINQLKTARDQAVASIKSGNPEDAFDTLENDFFGKMDDIREMQSVFETLSNLKNFSANFKREMTSAKRQIAKLDKQGEDTADLKNLLDQANEKGTELMNLLKNKPIDTEAVAATLEDLSSLRQDFQNNLQDLGGVGDLPWKQGKDQFQSLKISPEFSKSMNQSFQPQQ